MRMPNANTPPLLASVSLVWYLVVLVPILGIGWLSLKAMLPAYGLIISIFLFCFWLFSLLFALYEKFVRRNANVK